MGIILGMGTLSIASRVVSMILGKMNKVDDAAMVEVVTTTLMVGTVVTAVGTAFAAAAKLAR